jgi:hypothetical protein
VNADVTLRCDATVTDRTIHRVHLHSCARHLIVSRTLSAVSHAAHRLMRARCVRPAVTAQDEQLIDIVEGNRCVLSCVCWRLCRRGVHFWHHVCAVERAWRSLEFAPACVLGSEPLAAVVPALPHVVVPFTVCSIYTPCIYVLNKIDSITIEVCNRLRG